MPRYKLRTLLMLLAIGPPILAGAITYPHGPFMFMLTLGPLFGLAFFFWRRLVCRGYI